MPSASVDSLTFVTTKSAGCGRNAVAAHSRVPTALLSSPMGLVLSLAPVYPAINRWAILCRPPDLGCRRAGMCGCASSSPRVSVVLRTWVAAPQECVDALLLRRVRLSSSGLGLPPRSACVGPIRPAGAIDNSPPFQRWVSVTTPFKVMRKSLQAKLLWELECHCLWVAAASASLPMAL